MFALPEYNEDGCDDDLFGVVDTSEQDIAELTSAIMAVEAPQYLPEPTQIVIEKSISCPPSLNLVNDDVREVFISERLIPRNDLFTQPINTTNTMEGHLGNVKLDERTFVGMVEPTQYIVAVRSNFEVKILDGYTEPKKSKNSNRGRKKIERKKKPRRTQGTGDEFNSQVSFHVRPRAPGDAGFDPKQKPYKFKVFRTGRLQLPGAKQTTINEVFDCIGLIRKMLNGALAPKEEPVLNSFSVVMKNYKFVAILPAKHILDLEALKHILLSEMICSRIEPPIFMVKFDYEESKLSIQFSTPTAKKPQKKVRVNIFMRGKINILGAMDYRTALICEYLHGVFGKNKSAIIVIEGGISEHDANNVAEECTTDILDYHEALLARQRKEFIAELVRSHNVSLTDTGIFG
jgi:hypothetical protein